MDTTAALRSIGTDARSLLASAQTRWDRPVPHCTGWDAAELTRHTGHLFFWVTTIVTSGEAVRRRSLEAPPVDPGELPAWFSSQLEQLELVLGDADPDAATWTFSTVNDHRVGWWHRRLAAEVAVHRWDAEHAVEATDGAPRPEAIDAEVATAGIGEFVEEFLPALLDHSAPDGPTGTLHLHATDGPTEWWIDLDHRLARPEHTKADTAIRGTRSDLFLWLLNRTPPEKLDVFGAREVLEAWSHLRF